MSKARQRRATSDLPRPPAEKNQRDDLVEPDPHGGGHGTQPAYLLGDTALLDGRPFGDLHAGPAGGVRDGKTGALAGFADAMTEHAAPDHTALLGEVGRRKGGKHLFLCAHILITSDWTNLSSCRSRWMRFNYMMSMYSVRLTTKATGQHLPSLLRTGTGCRSRTISLSQGTLRLFRTSAQIHSTGELRAPGQRDPQHHAVLAPRRRLHDQL